MARGGRLLLICLALAVAGSSLTAAARQSEIVGATIIAAARVELDAAAARLVVVTVSAPPASRSRPAVARGPLLILATRGDVTVVTAEGGGEQSSPARAVDLSAGDQTVILAAVQFEIVNRSTSEASVLVLSLDPAPRRPDLSGGSALLPRERS